MRSIIIGVVIFASALTASVQIGEVGHKVLFATNEWKTLTFQGVYTNPVVVFGAPGFAGSEPCVVRVKDVRSNSCSVRLQEVTNMDGVHTHETVYYMIIEKGDWILKGGLHIQAGKTNISDTVGTRVGNTFAVIPFYSSFDSAPVFVSTVMTFNDTNFVKTRHDGSTAADCSLALEEDENSVHIHGTETVGWIAAERKTGIQYTNKFEISTTSDSVTHIFYSQSFSQTFTSPPVVLAQMRSYDGPNNAETRVSNISSSDFTVKIEEDTTYDTEVNHTTETVDYFAFAEDGFLYALEGNWISISRGIYSPSGYLSPYSADQTVWQLKIILSSSEGVTNLNIAFQASGTGRDTQEFIPLVSLYSDVNGNGEVDSSDALIETNYFLNDNGSLIFHFGDLPASSTNLFLITYDVAGAYNNDTYALFFYTTNVSAYGDSTGRKLELLDDFETSYTLTVQTPSGIGIGEVGVLSKWVNENWQTIKLRKNYTSPVIVAMPVSAEEYDPAAVRLRNVTSSNFQIRLQEPVNEDGTHIKETVGYIVMEEGQFTMPGNKIVTAGKYDTSTTCGDSDPGTHFDTVNFGYTFSSVPAVFHQVMTYNDAYFVTTRARNSGTSSFQVALEEDQGATGDHGTETIGWIAVDTGSGTNNGIHYEIGRTSDSVKNDWYNINFSSAFSSPSVLISSLETYDGGDAAWVRYLSLSGTSASVKVEEDRNGDAEQNHTTERVDYAVFESIGDLIGTTNTAAGHLFVKCTNFLTNAYLEENQGPVKIMRIIFHNTNRLGNRMEVDSITFKLSDKQNNNIIPNQAVSKIEVVHFETNRPVLVKTNIETSGTETIIDLSPSPIYISNVSFSTSEIYIYAASNAVATNIRFSLESTNKILSYDSFYHTDITNHPFPGFTLPCQTSNAELVSYFYISHDTLADAGAWEPVQIRIENYNHRIFTNFTGSLVFDTAFGTTNHIQWTNYSGNGVFSNIPESDNCVYTFVPADKGSLDLYIKDTSEEVIQLSAYDQWMSGSSNNLRISGPKLKIIKTSYFSNSSSYTQISLNDSALVPGTKITYQIYCSNYGLTAALNVQIQDRITTNMLYVSNSLFLNGRLLSDEADSDAGDCGSTLANHITVVITNLLPEEAAVIRFSVILK